MVLLILLFNYNIYVFIMRTPIIYNYKNIKLHRLTKAAKLNYVNSTNNLTLKKNNVYNIKESILLLFKTFVDVLYLYILVFNTFYILYIIKYM